MLFPSPFEQFKAAFDQKAMAAVIRLEAMMHEP